jgi:hypothetical protein
LLIAFIAPLESDVVISLKTVVRLCFLLLSVGVRTSGTQETDTECMLCHHKKDTCVAMYCSVLQHVAVCCSMLQCVAAWKTRDEGLAVRYHSAQAVVRYPA